MILLFGQQSVSLGDKGGDRYSEYQKQDEICTFRVLLHDGATSEAIFQGY